MTKWNNLASLLMLVCMFAIISCKKKKDPEPEMSLPSISTSPVSSVLNTSAIGGGAVISEGSAAVTSKGICWDTLPAPDLTRGTVQVANSANNYTCALTGLKSYKKYYVRAFASNSNGTAYGDEITFTSSDTWNRIQPIGTPVKITAMKAKGSDVYLGTYEGVLYSPDKGNTWIAAGLGNLVISGIGISDNAVFASMNSTIYKSTDHGVTWTNVFTVPASPTFIDILINGNDIYAAMYGAVYVSQDNGATWAKASNGLPSTIQYARLAANANGVFLCSGSSLGIYKTNDKGATWTEAGHLPVTTNGGIYDIICAGNTMLVSQTPGNCYLSKDNAQNWTSCPDLDNRSSFFSLSENGDLFCASASGKCSLSRDNGTSWTAMTNNGLVTNIPAMTGVLVTDHAFFIGAQVGYGLFKLRR